MVFYHTWVRYLPLQPVSQLCQEFHRSRTVHLEILPRNDYLIHLIQTPLPGSLGISCLSKLTALEWIIITVSLNSATVIISHSVRDFCLHFKTIPPFFFKDSFILLLGNCNFIFCLIFHLFLHFDTSSTPRYWLVVRRGSWFHWCLR